MNYAIKSRSGSFSLVLILVAILTRECYGHDWPVHQAITLSAYQSSVGLSTFLGENFENPDSELLTASPPQLSIADTPIGWLEQGARMEDEETLIRTLDHFYTVISNRTPGQVLGITDNTEGPFPLYLGTTGIGVHSLGGGFITNSYAWASQSGFPGPSILGNSVGTNIYKWEDARNYELAALTNATDAIRNQNMALMLYTLGHVLHLNQDLTSPDHVRNDNHGYAPHRSIENYGVKTYLVNAEKPGLFGLFFPLKQHGWSYWQSRNFSKLLDFWDKNLYRGNAADLNADIGDDQTKQLGLAEWSNGNFLGEDALYDEVVWENDSFHHFPFPSLNTSVSKSPVSRPSHLRNGKAINRLDFDKTGDGITFPNHSVVNYFGWAMGQKNGSNRRLSASVPVWRVSVSVDDDNVLEAYHEQLIPKAIEYSAGILDYFFRGTISASVIGYDTNLMQYTNLVVNTSSQPFGAGNFYLYQDDNSANRTLLAHTNWSGILATNGGLVMLFPPPNVATNKLLLVYQGAIGVNGGGLPLDPVDTNVAIAATTFYPNVVWHNSFESDVGNITPGAGDIFCGGWQVDSGNVDVGANGTWGDGLSKAYEGNYLLDLDGSEPGTISTNLATVAGQTYTLSFVWCRNPDSIVGVLGDTNHVPSAEVLINDSVVMTLIGDMENSWSDLQWQQASYTFTATGSSTKLTFQSTSGGEDPGSISGIQLDAVYLYWQH